ncbi:MAG: hypothetical protein QOJ22_155 [Thermoleophilaceae bacterium]|nr:hypothetical protein [Thermoleophilaceae bacterium]
MRDEPSVNPHIRGQSTFRAVDAAIAALAARQHGVVARAQLAGLELGRRAIEHRLECDRLHSVHRGVYAVGHPLLSSRGRCMAAVLAAGPGAVLSHRSAGMLWEMRPSSSARVEVTAPRRVRRPDIRIHEAEVAPDEMTVVDRIPVTTAHRTLLDLAAVLALPQLERATERAEAVRLADPVPLDVLLQRHRGRRGTAALRAVLGKGVHPAMTRSELEDRFLTFLDAHDLPRPEVNAHLHLGHRWIEADFLWREQRLIVELDGRRDHGTRAAFERDRERDRILQADGWRVVRITWRQLHQGTDSLARDLARLLGLQARFALRG